MACLLCLGKGGGLLIAEEAPPTEPTATQEVVAADEKKEKPETATEAKTESKDEAEVDEAEAVDVDPAEEERLEVEAAVARPVNGDPVQIYGWREWVTLESGEESERFPAKLDTGALTSSIHFEEKHLFERDGRKWVRFIVNNPRDKDSKRLQLEAPLVRIARIKEPGDEEDTEMRETVMLRFQIGDRRIKAEFTLNNRSNMLSPILIGRKTIRELGWVDPSRAYLADKKVQR